MRCRMPRYPSSCVSWRRANDIAPCCTDRGPSARADMFQTCITKTANCSRSRTSCHVVYIFRSIKIHILALDGAIYTPNGIAIVSGFSRDGLSFARFPTLVDWSTKASSRSLLLPIPCGHIRSGAALSMYFAEAASEHQPWLVRWAATAKLGTAAPIALLASC